MSRAVALAIVLTALAGCSSSGRSRDRDGGVESDLASGADAAGPCTIGQKRCDGTLLSVCDAAGGEVFVEDCAARTDASLCIDGLGCRACTPGASMCSADGKTVEACNPDGTAFAVAEDCSIVSGKVCDAGMCVQRCSDDQSYLGCKYLAVPLANSQLDSTFSYAVVLANPQSYAVAVSIVGGALGTTKSVTLAPRGQSGDVQTVELPWVSKLLQKRPACYQSGVPDPLDCVARSSLALDGAYRIETNGPIAAYQFNPLQYVKPGTNKYSYTSDASLLLPETALGKHYLAMTYGNWSNETLGPYSEDVTLIHGGLIAIAGTTDNTTLTVQLSATVYDPNNENLELAPGTYDFSLGRGDVLQLLGKKADEDLTGTRIVADQKIAVFVGHDCTQVPDGRPACNHLEEQLLPQQAWGKSYAVSPLRVRAPDEVSVVRIVSQTSNNQLVFDGIAAPAACSAPLGNGAMCEFETGTPFQVSAMGSFLVAQFMRGQGPPPHEAEICSLHSGDSECAAFTGGPQQWCSVHYTDPLCEGYIKWCSFNATHPSCQGDPSMVFEVPTLQYRGSYDILVPSTYPVSRLNVVAPTGAAVLLDGVALGLVPDVMTSTIGAGYDLFVMPISGGAHHLESTDLSRFGVKVYGVATYTAYVYAGGLDLEALEIF